MIIRSSAKKISGKITTPGSKSHTIRACIFAALAEGTSYIRNPLTSLDCISALHAVESIGAKAIQEDRLWTITGIGGNIRLPDDVINVGNSGSVLYFFTPICATLPGWTILTGDKSIRTRPVNTMLDALEQLGCETHISRPNHNAPPIMVKGPMKSGFVVTEGTLSQYISGIMIASTLMVGQTEIALKNPKECPFLHMTELWLKSLGASLTVSPDFKRIQVRGPHRYPTFDRTIPSDWESAAFPIAAALVSDSEITIENVDTSDSQGDAKIVDIVRQMGADLEIIEDDAIAQTGHLIVRGGNTSRLPNKGKLRGIRVNCSGLPDAVPALAVIACFAEGHTILEDIAVCRHKETDRIAVMAKELTELGADISETADSLTIHGKGKNTPDFALHGGTVQSYDDHRIAMALSVMGIGIENGEIHVNDAECCSVSFPNFFEVMNSLGCGFISE